MEDFLIDTLRVFKENEIISMTTRWKGVSVRVFQKNRTTYNHTHTYK